VTDEKASKASVGPSGETGVTGAENGQRLASADAQGDRPSGETRRPSGPGVSDSDQPGEGGPGAQTLTGHLRQRHPEGFPRQVDVDRLEQKLDEGFRRGDPQRVWEVSRELLAFVRSAVDEAARARFEVNFGTEICQRCTGLKAGPKVTATCFQVRACYYTHFREDKMSPKQHQIIGKLLANHQEES